MEWYKLKELIRQTFGVPSDYLHVSLGFLLYMVVALIMRRYRWGPAWALLPVIILQSINEALDATDWLRWTGVWPWPEMVDDTLVTVVMPFVVASVWMQKRIRKRQKLQKQSEYDG